MVEEEVDASVREAFAEGYKAGRMEATELWKPLLQAERDRAAEAERARSQAERKVLYGVLVGFLSGLASSWITIQLVGR